MGGDYSSHWSGSLQSLHVCIGCAYNCILKLVVYEIDIIGFTGQESVHNVTNLYYLLELHGSVTNANVFRLVRWSEALMIKKWLTLFVTAHNNSLI